MEATPTRGSDYNRGVIALLKGFTVIVILGALNWGLIGFFNYNLVDDLFGGNGTANANGASRVLYGLVGLAGLGALILLPALKRSTIGPEESHSPRWIHM